MPNRKNKPTPAAPAPSQPVAAPAPAPVPAAAARQAVGELAWGILLGVLAVGGTLKDAALFAGVSYKRLRAMRRIDPDFAAVVDQTITKGKAYHLKKIGKAPQWQASAWILERKWPREFARRPKPSGKSSRRATIRVRRVPPADSPPAPPPTAPGADTPHPGSA